MRLPPGTRTHTRGHAHAHTRAPEPGDPAGTDTGGWLGVISADRAPRSKRRGKGGRRRASKGGWWKVNKNEGGEGTGCGEGPTVCPPARPSALDEAPAARPPPRSGIHTKWRHGRDEHPGRGGRKGVEGGGGATERPEPRHVEEGRGGGPPESGRKEPKRKGEAAGRRKEPSAAEPNPRGRTEPGKSRRQRARSREGREAAQRPTSRTEGGRGGGPGEGTESRK